MADSNDDKKKEEVKVSKPQTPISTPWGWSLPNLSEDQAKWLDDWFNKRGLSAASSAPRLCSKTCTFIDRCPLNALQVPLPIGCHCPIEDTQITNWANKMKEALAIPDEDLWSLSLLEYAGVWMVLMQRALSEKGSDKIVVDSYRGVDRDGNALYEKKVNPAHTFAERAQRIIQLIGKQLVATREAKVKLLQMQQAKGPEEILREIESRLAESDSESEDKYKKIREKAKQKLLKRDLPPIIPSSSEPDPDGGLDS